MSITSSYPIILLPEIIKVHLAKKLIAPSRKPKKKSQVKFNSPKKSNYKVVKSRELVEALRYLGWLFTGVVLISLMADLLNGSNLWDLLPGILLLIFKTCLVTVISYFLAYLDQAQKCDRQQETQDYWQDNLETNKIYYQQVQQLVKQDFLGANSQFKFSQRRRNKQSSKHSFKRGIAKEEVQQGVSEAYFYSYLHKYFNDCELATDHFPLSNGYGYTSDFSLITPQGRWGIDIEIDEPYEGKSKSPHHCQDDGKDHNRNQYFLERGWIVVRFSEFQIVKYPESCCRLIALLLSKLGIDKYLSAFVAVDNLPNDSTWTTATVNGMVSRKYRELYLDEAGLFKYDVAREKRNMRYIAKLKQTQGKATKKGFFS